MSNLINQVKASKNLNVIQIFNELDSVTGEILSDKYSIEQLKEVKFNLVNIYEDLDRLRQLIDKMIPCIDKRIKKQCKHEKKIPNSTGLFHRYICSDCGIPLH